MGLSEWYDSLELIYITLIVWGLMLFLIGLGLKIKKWRKTKMNYKKIKKRIKDIDYILRHEYIPHFLKIEYYNEMTEREVSEKEGWN